MAKQLGHTVAFTLLADYIAKCALSLVLEMQDFVFSGGFLMVLRTCDHNDWSFSVFDWLSIYYKYRDLLCEICLCL